MGNASSGADGRLDGRTAALPKDGHVLRLWAEVFVASVDPAALSNAADLKWTKVTEDIVPVNVTCTCKLPTTRFHVVAYNSQVEKVCDAYIEQPGHKIEHPSESFVHWYSKDSDKHWGLNFTSKEDAVRFETICTMTGTFTVSKSTSFGTVRSRSKAASRERDPKKSASSPGEIFNTTTLSEERPEERARSQTAKAMLTLPRFHQRSPRRLDTRAIFGVDHDGPEGAVETHNLPEGISVNIHPASARLGTVSAPVSLMGEQPSFATVTVPGKNGTLCKDNLRSILYGSGGMPSPRGASEAVASSECPASDDTSSCACTATDRREGCRICSDAVDHEDDTATIVGDHSTMIPDATTPVRACVVDVAAAAAVAERGSSSSSMCLPGSLSPTAADERSPYSCAELDSSIASRLLLPVLQSTPLVPGFGSEAGAGDPGISLPTRSTPTPTTGSSSSSGARRSLAPWLPERTAAAAAAEARLRARSCTDSGIGGTTCSESAESVRTAARSDACSSTGNGPLSSSGSVASSSGRRPGSAASSYSSEGSGHTASTKRSGVSRYAKAVSAASSSVSASADASDGDDSDSGHSMTTVTATGSLLSLAHQTGATRKAGWLEVKNWLVRRGRRVQMASRRKWKRYWVSLKGSTLLFYQRSSGGSGGGGRLPTSARSQAARESKDWLGAAAAAAASGGIGVKDSPHAALARDDDGRSNAAEREKEDDDEQEEADDESLPRHLLDVSDCLVQPVPEHPRRQHVFAVSTHRGDAYLFQAQSRVDHDQWIATIHGACAAQYARQLGREDTQRMLIGEIERLEEEIEQDSKMKNMAELQLSTTQDAKIGRAIVQQMAMWEKKQECRYMDQYRYRCYLAALRGDGCGAEQPNPKSLLAAMSQASKSSLNRIGTLGVTTFHVLICSRLAETYDAVLARCKRRRGVNGVGGASSGSSFASATGTPRSSAGLMRHERSATPSSMSVDGGGEAADDVVAMVRSISSHSSLYREGRAVSLVESRGAGGSSVQRATSLRAPAVPAFSRNLKRVDLPNGQAMAVDLKADTTADELLDYVCSKRQLTSSDCFLRVRLSGTEEFICPHRADCVGSMDMDKIEIRTKVVFQVELSRQEGSCGLQLEAELGDGAETEDELRVFVCALSPRSTAAEAGLLVGDEILVINGKMVSDLDMVFIENLVASSSSLRMTVRSCRLEKPVAGRVTNQLMQHADIYISNMMCPPPPSQARLPDKFIDELIVPAPSWVQAEVSASGSGEELAAGSLVVPLLKQQPSPAVHDHKIKELLQGAEQVTHLCRMANERVLDDADPSGVGRSVGSGSTVVDGAISPSVASTTSTQPAAGQSAATAAAAAGASSGGSLQPPLSEAQRLRKVVVELIDTERAYVKDLNCLIERYLEPLKEETFLSSEEVIHLFGNIQEIVHFQRQFLSNLEEAADVAEFSSAARTSELKGVLHSIAGSFLYYANHFRLYSSFCASHSRAQKVFTTEENAQLKEFLRARNPKQQHSATLESYLIKPIQRVLKYPLLLAQLRNLSQANSDEQEQLNDALGSMEKVAEHINEMQKIYEEYGHEFDELMRQLNRHEQPHQHRRHQQQQIVNGGCGTPTALARGAGTSSPSMSVGTAYATVGRVASLNDRHRKVEINVGDLDYYGEAEWLNATDTVSKPRKGCVHVTTIFVFKNGIVFLCQEKPKPKKKGKGNTSVRSSIVDSANSSGCDVVERRFLPVDCLQVRTLPTEHAHVAMWELLLLKSVVEGRAAEKSYLLAHSDVRIRDAFIQNIRQVIKESVDRMTVKGGSRHGGKARVASAADFLVRGSGGRTAAVEITTRYSMNFDLEKVHEDLGEPVPERSRTIGDLQSVDSAYAAAADRASLSRASVGSTDSTGAKLVYSSQDPVRYSSKGSLEAAADSPPGSPVWKQRSPGSGDSSDSSRVSLVDYSTAAAAAAFDFPGGLQLAGSGGSSNGGGIHRSLLPSPGPLEGTTEC